MTALMRLAELDNGQILLDGVDIKSLGLQRLRSSIAVVPQDPVLFSGSVKTNLDPFDQYDSDRLMDVLERVGLWSSESASAVSSLEDRVLQDGSNFSVGQRYVEPNGIPSLFVLSQFDTNLAKLEQMLFSDIKKATFGNCSSIVARSRGCNMR